MNNKKTSNFRGFGMYAFLILLLVFFWYAMRGNTTTSGYKRADLIKALEDDKISFITISLSTKTNSLLKIMVKTVKVLLYFMKEHL